MGHQPLWKNMKEREALYAKEEMTDEDGNQIQALYLDTIEFEEQVYAALMTMQSDESGEILIFRIEDSEYEDMDDYVTVEDERILKAVYEIVKERFGDELSFTD